MSSNCIACVYFSKKIVRRLVEINVFWCTIVHAINSQNEWLVMKIVHLIFVDWSIDKVLWYFYHYYQHQKFANCQSTISLSMWICVYRWQRYIAGTSPDSMDLEIMSIIVFVLYLRLNIKISSAYSIFNLFMLHSQPW